MIKFSMDHAFITIDCLASLHGHYGNTGTLFLPFIGQYLSNLKFKKKNNFNTYWYLTIQQFYSFANELKHSVHANMHGNLQRFIPETERNQDVL